ncbi:MAG TPA: sugar phosphate isomerase/epimerase [Chloroflexota bacterium]|jgi:inosose dehydratase|nr:sugar phosphate isomerase/epimerase [Chloroflexota bacterium]
MYIACSTITWGSFRAAPDRNQQPDPYAGRAGYARMLDEVREAGYSHVVAGGGRRRASPDQQGGEPMPSTPEEVLAFLAEHGLKPAPGYYSGQPLYDPANRPGEIEGARRAAAFMRALGLDALFVGPVMFPHRRDTAGHYPQGNRPDSLSEAQWQEECETLNRMGEACRAEGVWLCLHNHAGSCWETEDELERLAQGTDPSLVAFGPDVGHMVWGGIDPVTWFERHMGRVKSIHIKDMHATVLRRCREEKLTYAQTAALGVFAEIGEGGVRWPALFELWRAARYEGAVIVETDRTTKPSAKESATISRRYLRDVIQV